MANEFRKVTDQNGVDHPICDDTRVAWADAGKSVKKNYADSKAVSKSASNVTFTVNADKSISLSGTASANTGIEINTYTGAELKAIGSSLIISGGISNNAFVILRLADWTNIAQSRSATEEQTIDTSTLTDGTTYYLSCAINNGENVSGKTFYPMLRKAGTPSGYVAPIPDNTELFPRSEQAVLGAKNIWDDSIALSSNASATVTKTTDGYAVQTNTTANSGGQFNQTPLRTRYTPFGNITVSFEYKSDIACAGYIGKSDVTLATDWTKVSYSVDGSTMGAICFYNRDTTKTPLIEMRNMMITLVTDTDLDFVPPALTNRELTDAVAYQRQSITKNGLSIACAKFGKNFAVFSIVNGTNTEAYSAGDTIFTLDEFNNLFSDSDRITLSTESLDTYAGSIRIWCQAESKNVVTRTPMNAGTVLRTTIVCIIN